jgi:hypothetical protein
MPKNGGPEMDYMEKSPTLEGFLMCVFCSHEYCGNATRARYHLAGIRGRGVIVCPSPPEGVRAAMIELERTKIDAALKKQKRQRLEVASAGGSSHSDHGIPNSLLNSPPEYTERGTQERASPSLARDMPSAFSPERNRPRAFSPPPGILKGLTKEEKEDLDASWGRAFYATGIPFNVVKNPYFEEAMLKTAALNRRLYKGI